MDKKEFISELTRVFSQNKLGSMLNLERAEKFHALTERMLEENENYNRTAIKEPKKIILNHYADCAVLAARLPTASRCCRRLHRLRSMALRCCI